MTVHILNIQPVTDRGNLRAFISLQMGKQTVHYVRWIQQPGQRGYVQEPHQSENEQDGRPRRVVEWPTDWKRTMAAAVLATEYGQVAQRRAETEGGRR